MFKINKLVKFAPKSVAKLVKISHSTKCFVVKFDIIMQ